MDGWGSDRICFINHGHRPTCPQDLDSPILCLVSVAEDTGGLLRGHPLGHLGVELGVELLLLHPLELELSVKFLNNLKVKKESYI